ncbi:MAG: hypothetical protein OXC63_09300 [Aestuariivita sp.]|nr:hypothetical protein [Aestuariivita sp.]
MNGRTILDTKDAGDISWCHCKSPKNRPILIGGVLFICTLILELLVSWSGSVSDMADLNSWQRFFFFNITTLSNLLFPALWGGLGACIFLAKRISNKMFELAYEESRMLGDRTRIFLGSVMGVVAVVLIFPDFTERAVLGDTRLGPAMVAFIAGLGVKPIYSAFELLSEELARRFSGNRQADRK